MRVWAENEEEARENVALNGWQILSIENITPGAMRGTAGDTQPADSASTDTKSTENNGNADTSQHLLKISKLGEGDIQPIGNMTVKNGDSVDFTLKPAPCQTLQKLVVNGDMVDVTDTYKLESIMKDTYVVAVFIKNGNECDNNKISDDDLKEIAIIYFDLGKFKTTIPADTKKVLAGLDKKKKYVIVGHTDDVRVIPNVEYKDNIQLSKKRAKFLNSELGFKSGAKLMGMGPAYPIAPNKKNGQPLNRRAVIYERR